MREIVIADAAIIYTGHADEKLVVITGYRLE